MSRKLRAVDAYIANSAPFAQPILHHLRATVHSAVPAIEEAMKWSMPFFVYQGIILANMAAFKRHCSFGIWKENVQPLVKKHAAEKEGGGGTGSFGKVTTLDELPSTEELKSVLVEAARKIDSGERDRNWSRATPKKRVEVEVPESLAAALKKNRAASANFAAMRPSCRREYCEWIAEAKREETRARRIETAMQWMAEGRSRNWKYADR